LLFYITGQLQRSSGNPQPIFKEATDEFTVRVVKAPEEIKGLLEVGFEYVCEKEDLMFLRKRK